MALRRMQDGIAAPPRMADAVLWGRPSQVCLTVWGAHTETPHVGGHTRARHCAPHSGSNPRPSARARSDTPTRCRGSSEPTLALGPRGSAWAAPGMPVGCTSPRPHMGSSQRGNCPPGAAQGRARPSAWRPAAPTRRQCRQATRPSRRGPRSRDPGPTPRPKGTLFHLCLDLSITHKSSLFVNKIPSGGDIL